MFILSQLKITYYLSLKINDLYSTLYDLQVKCMCYIIPQAYKCTGSYLHVLYYIDPKRPARYLLDLPYNKSAYLSPATTLYIQITKQVSYLFHTLVQT